MLQCPFCDLALRTHIEQDVEIDVCVECRGIWLDQGELETISNGKGFAPHAQAVEEVSYLRCPRCDTRRFATIHMEEGVLAQCTECQGLFVEGKVLDPLSGLPAPPHRHPSAEDTGPAGLLGPLIQLLTMFW